MHTTYAGKNLKTGLQMQLSFVVRTKWRRATSTFSNLSILVSTVALCFQIHRTKSVDTSHSVLAQIYMFLVRGTGALNTPARAVALFARFCKEIKITRRNANEFSRDNHDFF